jgi:hypothetical protein
MTLELQAWASMSLLITPIVRSQPIPSQFATSGRNNGEPQLDLDVKSLKKLWLSGPKAKSPR